MKPTCECGHKYGEHDNGEFCTVEEAAGTHCPCVCYEGILEGSE